VPRDRYPFCTPEIVSTDGTDAHQYVHRFDEREPTTFPNVTDWLAEAYPAEWRDLAFLEDSPTTPTSPTAYPVDGFGALVNPQWIDNPEAVPRDIDSAVWHVPTVNYRLLTHDTVFGMLDAAVQYSEYDNRFGVVRTRREGAEAHLDMFFDELHMEVDGKDIYIGLSTGNDYCGKVRVYVDVIALVVTEGSSYTMRHLIDRETRRHSGDAEDEIRSFYEDSLERIDGAIGKIRDIVGESMHYTLPLDELYIDSDDVYGALGLPDTRPNKVATAAADRLETITPSSRNPTAWHCYRAGMWAIENRYSVRDTTASKKHMSSINQWLFNPAQAEKQAIAHVADRMREDSESLDVDIEDEAAALRERKERITDGVAAYESARERLAALLRDDGTEISEPDSDAAESDGDERADAPVTTGD